MHVPQLVSKFCNILIVDTQVVSRKDDTNSLLVWTSSTLIGELESSKWDDDPHSSI